MHMVTTRYKEHRCHSNGNNVLMFKDVCLVNHSVFTTHAHTTVRSVCVCGEGGGGGGGGGGGVGGI